jgi:hypothetical protein
MGKVQHRRTVSMKALVYARLKHHCRERGVPVTAFVEAMIVDALDDEQAPHVSAPVGGYPKRTRESTDVQAKDLAKQPPASFTF